MSQLLRFFRDHLRTHAPTIAGASLLLLMAGLCQGALIASIKAGLSARPSFFIRKFFFTVSNSA